MTEPGTGAEQPLPFVAPCRDLEPLAALGWIRLGLADIRAAPGLSLAFGLLIALISIIMSLVAFRYGSYWLVLAALSGFVFVGPVLCLGLYAISATLERGERPSVGSSMREAGVLRRGTVMVFALILLVVFLLWVRAGSMVHVFFPMEANPQWRELLGYLGIGTAVGSIFAGITFAASAFSLPMLMHRDVDAVTAVVTSVNAVLRNKLAMLVWIMLIVAGLLFGFATGFLGLILTIPLIGYATWHGYQDTIDASEFPRHQEGVAARPKPENVHFDI